MSRRARAYKEAYEAKHHPEAWDPDWRDDRDSDDTELPERDEPEPVHTFH